MPRIGYVERMPPAAGGFRCPLNDLVTFYGEQKKKRIEVRVSDREITKGPNDDGWADTRLIAIFTDYTWALDFAKAVACHQFVWAGGVLIR